MNNKQSRSRTRWAMNDEWGKLLKNSKKWRNKQISNMLTLRIGPFWVDEKKCFFQIFFRSKNFLSAESGDLNNGAGTTISSNFDFNMLILRIGPFWVDEKKNVLNFFSRSKNFLSAEHDLNNGAGTKISSNFGFNMLTLRIGPFIKRCV